MSERHAPSERPALLRLTLLVVSVLAAIPGPAIAPALPGMADFFRAEPRAELWVRLVLTLPALTIAVGAPIVGLIIDRWGRRRLLIASAVLYGIFGSVSGLFDDLLAVLVSRALLGFAVGAVIATATTLIGDFYAGVERGKMLGLQAACMGLGSVLFPALGGLLADVSWRAPFGIHLLGLAVVPMVLAFVPEPRVGGVEEEAGEAAAAPAFPWKVVAVLYAMAFATLAIFFMIPVNLPFYFQALGVTSNTRVGLAISLGAFAAAISSMAYGFVSARLKAAHVFVALGVLLGAGHLLIARADAYGAALVGMVVGGLGFGFLVPHLNTLATAVVSPAVRGRVIGGLTTCIFLGQFFSPILTQPAVAELGLAGAFGLTGGVMVALGLLFLPVAFFGRGPLARRLGPSSG